MPILLCFATALFKELSNNRYWYMAMGIYLCIFLCFGYMTGSDWRAYEFWYDNLDFNKFYYGYSNEPGYYLLMALMNKLHIPFWVFFTLIKTALFIIVYKSTFDLCRNSGWLSLMYFVPCFGLYFFIDNPMRNCIAVGIFMLSTKYIIEQRFWPFFFLTLLAALFHVSVLFVIPLFFVFNKDVKKSVYIILYFGINLLFWNRNLIIDFFISAVGRIPYAQTKVITYFLLDSAYSQGEIFSLMLIWQTFLFVLLVLNKEKIISALGDKGMFVFNCSMFYFLLVRFATSIQVLMRLQLYFSVYVCVCVGLLILSFEWRLRLSYTIVLFVISLYICFNKITATYVYVPYSNIVEYALKGERPSYSTRFKYNYKYSPYYSSSSKDK